MKIPELLCLILILHLQLYMLSVESLKCYVCNDCEIYYNETHLIQCDTEDRCIVSYGTEIGRLSSLNFFFLDRKQ